MKALVGGFNQEKALAGAFSVIVKTDCETERSIYSTTHNTPVCCRGLAERCPVPMKTLITFGSPHQGQFGVPDCRETTHSPLLCELVRQLISQGGAGGLQTLLLHSSLQAPTSPGSRTWWPWPSTGTTPSMPPNTARVRLIIRAFCRYFHTYLDTVWIF